MGERRTDGRSLVHHGPRVERSDADAPHICDNPPGALAHAGRSRARRLRTAHHGGAGTEGDCGRRGGLPGGIRRDGSRYRPGHAGTWYVDASPVDAGHSCAGCLDASPVDAGDSRAGGLDAGPGDAHALDADGAGALGSIGSVGGDGADAVFTGGAGSTGAAVRADDVTAGRTAVAAERVWECAGGASAGAARGSGRLADR